MATAAQALANQSNAQRSTGPTTTAGASRSARNSFSHGLNSTSENLFAQIPEAQEDFTAFRTRLLAQLKPKGETVLAAFDRYAFARFQAERARAYETQAEHDMAAAFGDDALERRWMRFVQTRLRLSREAEAALRHFRAEKALELEASLRRLALLPKPPAENNEANPPVGAPVEFEFPSGLEHLSENYVPDWRADLIRITAGIPGCKPPSEWNF